MKSLSSLLFVSLIAATGTVLAQTPVKSPTPQAAPPHAMDHGKMDMSQMTPADHEKMAMAQFAKLDTNNDGMLSKAEFAKLHAMMSMQHGSMDRGTMDHSMMDMQQGKMGMSGMKSPDRQKMAAEEFAKLDTNKDGKLSKTEIPTTHPMSAHFNMLDANKDGSVSKDEFTQHQGM